MAGERHGQAYFPGIFGEVSCTFTLSHGITPSVAELICAPQPTFEALGGPLLITDTVGAVLLPNCKIQKHTIEYTDRGIVWRLLIMDRRWKWAFGSINGNYNVRDAQGLLIKRTERTIQQLAALCLEAAGEPNANIDGLPFAPQIRPLVEWNNDNPMAALANIAEAYGCRIVYNPFTDSVFVTKNGFGFPLPDGPIMEDSLSLEPPERPDSLLLVGAPAQWNMYLALEAVGLDLDDKIKPIDELLYRPTNGWGQVVPPSFLQVRFDMVANGFPLAVAIEAQRRAQDTVYRWYRITVANPADPTQNLVIPGTNIVVVDRRQLLPIGGEQADIVLGVPQAPGAEGEHRPLNAVVVGLFNRGRLDEFNLTIGADKLQVYGMGSHANIGEGAGFSINTRDGILQFPEYVWRYFRPPGAPADGRQDELRPGLLFLRTAVGVRDLITNSWIYYQKPYVFGPPIFFTNPRIVKQDDLRLVYNVAYDANFNVTGFVSNQADIDIAANHALLGTASKYLLGTPREILYAGIWPLAPSGLVQQITWSVGPGGATTRASQGTEHAFWLPLYAERRRQERFRAFALTNAFQLPRGAAPESSMSTSGAAAAFNGLGAGAVMGAVVR